MSGRWVIPILVAGLALTFINLAILVSQFSTPATARSGTSAGHLLDNEDFADELTKFIRKAVRSYCTVGKKGSIDC